MDSLTDEQAGKLIKAIVKYQNTGAYEKGEFWLDILMHPFICQFNRDLEKYENVVNRNRNNGSKGGRPKEKEEEPKETQRNPKKPTGLFENPQEPKKPDSDSVNDNDRDNDTSLEKKQSSPLSKYPEHLIQESEKFKEWSSNQMPILLNKKQKEEAQLTYLKLRSNGYSKDQVKEAIIYATTDDFWKMNFRVPSKLIKKDKEGTQYIDVFLLKAKAKVESQPKLKEYNPHVA